MKNPFSHLFLTCIAVLFMAACAQQKEPLNILLFTADDLDKLSLGCYGSEVDNITPNIDQLAEQGLRFNHAYVNNSICAPSRGILATGLYGHNSGVMGFMKMAPQNQHPLIMEILKEHGYQVGVLSKVAHSTPKEAFQWDFVREQSELGYGRNPELYYQGTREFLESAKKSKMPFYLMVNSDDPHRPFFVPGQELEKGMKEPSRIYHPDDIPIPGFLPDLPGVRKEVSYYYNSVKRLDDTFGKVMQALEESGFKDNTLVIFMSDNGMAVPFAKCDNYFASSRTPWIVRWPGVVEEGSINDINLISEVDFYPTILDAAGIKTKTNYNGVSRLFLYKGKSVEKENYVFTQIDNKHSGQKMPKRSDACPMRGIQDRDFLYIFNAWSYSDAIYYNNNEGLTMQAMQQAATNDVSIAKRVQSFRIRPVEEFYDLRNDPNCLKNIIDDSNDQVVLDDMRIALEGWMKEMNDPLLSVFINRDKPDLVREKLYALYPMLEQLIP